MTPLIIILFVFMMIMVMMSVAFITLLERKILSYMQCRKGPNKIILLGLMQPVSDGVKLFMKESIYAYIFNKIFYFIFPFFSFLYMIMYWVLYFYNNFNIIFFDLMFFMLISGLSVYTHMGGGYVSNSKYSLLGSWRSVAQMVSYEVSMIFFVLSIFSLSKSFSLKILKIYMELSIFTFFGFMFMFFCWFVIILAELNRAPFDFSEGESELVSGFNIEYGSEKFAFYFLGEYGMIIFMMYLTSLFFFNNLLMFFLIFLILFVRGCFPRFRYDNLMYLAWKVFLPFSLMYFVSILLALFM